MDPNIALDKLREMCAALALIDAEEDLRPADLWDIASQFEALDQWLSNGGFLPSEWRQPDTLPGVP